MPKRLMKAGKYEIVGRIARGGMGAVYKAKHPTLNRHVILKQLTLKGGGGFVERFKREASLMLDFRNEHIVQVYDHFKEGSSYYIVMEYVDGIGLDKLISERKNLSNEAAILVLGEICKALKYAHDKAVIHRDIKPANILLSREGEVKLTDFGIATTKEADEDGLTRAGMTLGTPAYMSPEQISDTRKVDKRADIYSLGVVFYEMITGTKPFPNVFKPEALNAINRGIFVKPQKINPAIPGAFRHIIKKTMNHRLRKRFPDLKELTDILARYTRSYKNQEEINADIKKYLSGEEISLPGLRLFRRRPGEIRKFRLAISLSAAIAGLLLLGGLFSFYRGYYHEYFMKRESGSVEVAVRVPEKYFKDPESVYASAELLRAGNEKKQPPARFRLLPARKNILYQIQHFPDSLLKKSTEKDRLLTTGVRYLPFGEYTLTLFVESQKHIVSFYLLPRAVQKQDADTYARKLIQMDLKEQSPKSIRITHRIYDAETGDSLYGITDIMFSIGAGGKEKKWMDWKEHRSNPKLRAQLDELLLSGRRYNFNYRAPLYYTKTIRLRAERIVDALTIEVGLIKEPGRLVVTSDTPELKILIDNRAENFTGGEKKAFVQYGSTIKGSREFALPGGNYVLTVKKDARHLQNIQLRVEAGQKTEARVSYDPEGKVISLTSSPQ